MSSVNVPWDPELLKRYDLQGPRYTSYPTAPQFLESFDAQDFAQAIAKCNASERDLSLYFHIPFCETLCYYCGCNKIVTHHKERAMPYLEALEREMSAIATQLDTTKPVAQLHWGGGTPTYISESEMRWLMAATRRHFNLLPGDALEASVEVHPGRMSVDKIYCLRDIGFNRLSMGVQDFDPDVQKAVNRYNSVEQVNAIMAAANECGFQSISMDIIYGLPLQSVASLSKTLDEVIALSPDRISAFGYAHLPHLFKSQGLIDDDQLPAAQQKLDMLQLIIERLQAAGYVYVGMDHFAKTSDSLVKAQNEQALYRNFQGYSTHKGCELLAFGVSAISYFGDTYIKNSKDINEYQNLINANTPAFVSGVSLTREDLIRKELISQLICHFELNFATFNQQFDIDMAQHFAPELQALTPMVADGLVTLTPTGIQVNSAGRLLIRRICMVFDQYLKSSSTALYSKVI
ncbi:oxygen-independent coproporphyrinogen III oxidase [Gilvimarinus polysaccharolyticus]|uniref:oxygen-independent coproporphyrinogen III oxidase n=1 Tax=Gilvimarinus polysaccharolyticus TaxID=863921 RepID=UPI0006738736|nr:oxygen-independent coproporphyrinogen III oxidase [Gilvimarinus polysaccharolyticus]